MCIRDRMRNLLLLSSDSWGESRRNCTNIWWGICCFYHRIPEEKAGEIAPRSDEESVAFIIEFLRRKQQKLHRDLMRNLLLLSSDSWAESSRNCTKIWWEICCYYQRIFEQKAAEMAPRSDDKSVAFISGYLSRKQQKWHQDLTRNLLLLSADVWAESSRNGTKIWR